MGLNNLLPEGSREYHEAKALPAGTTRVWHEGYERVNIPPPRRLPKATGDELVKIASLPDWAQAVFPGTKVRETETKTGSSKSKHCTCDSAFPCVRPSNYNPRLVSAPLWSSI